MSATQQTETGGDASAVRVVRTFLCYRREGASPAAEWLYKLLHGYTYRDRDHSTCRLEVYFDQMEPGVPDWKTHHQPSLESSVAFIVIVTHGLATDFSERGDVDWSHRELGWWIEHRNAAPIVVDLTENERWIPVRIRERWPNINRLLVDKNELQRHAPVPADEYGEDLRKRIVATIVESEHATVHEQLAESRKKNRQLMIASVVAALALAAAIWGWWIARENRDAALAQREISRHTVQFITNLIAAADPDHELGNKMTVHQLLLPARAAIASETSPPLKVSLLSAVGSVYTGLNDSDAALAALLEAEKLIETNNLELEGVDQFQLQHAIGEAYLYSKDSLGQALPYLTRAQSLATSAGVDRSPQASAKVSLGDNHARSEPPNRTEAQSLYEQALALDNEKPTNWVGVGRDLNRLGNLALDSERRDLAREYFTRAIETLQQFPPGSNTLFAAQFENDFATVLHEDGKLPDALERFSKSSEAFKSAYGDRSTEYGVAENNIARILIELDKLDAARTHAERSVQVEEATGGPAFSGLAFAKHNLALVLRESGANREAEDLFTEALKIADANNRGIGSLIRVHLAEMELSRNDLKDAAELLGQADLDFQESESAEGWPYALYESAMGELRRRECKLGEAEELLKRSHDVLKARWPGGNLFTRNADARQRALDAARKQSSCAGN